MPRSEIAESEVFTSSAPLDKCQIALQSSCVILRSPQQGTSVPLYNSFTNTSYCLIF